ncbi:sigma-70 family RNA polymerase sigma factor [Frigoriglobus tundricola]|uniref:Uncharacterized protein n=1 Tax=Frigoriglobus tundricola TaxID=2774151 RepID=A0A6M5Z2H9_9BACT|nr:sigma-70 family RNA polymerase sigma factor [Frigoriglobus tundricola]QJX00610.1 hypothetical protein FTUN_8242 [Frigoriglobus tundricola]
MLDPRRGTALYRAAESLARLKEATSDRALLHRFTRDHDPAAFTELLARHGPAVWGVCRRVTRHHADAEDVFQATFLVLARQAARVQKAASVGSWLYGVALRIGRKVRAKGDRVPIPARLTSPAAPLEPPVALSWNEVRGALDEELARLPDRLRAVVLLCYFQGMTQDEAAAELGWTARTVKARVARARELLRARLTRRGIELSAALAVPLLTAELVPAVPGHLLTALAASAAGLARSGSPGTDLSARVVALARTEVPTVSLFRLVVLVTTAAGLLTAGSLIGRPADPAAERDVRLGAAAAPPPTVPEPKLPATGIRIGTKEFRQVGWHTRVFFTDAGKTLMTAGERGTVRFWDVQRGETVHEIDLKGNHHDAAATPDGRLLAVVGYRLPKGNDDAGGDALWLIDAVDRKVRHCIGIPERLGGNHQKVCISDDGKRVVVEHEGDVRIFDTKSGEELMRHKGRINAGTLALSRDGKLIAFGRYDLYLWKWDSGEEPKKFVRVASFGVETAGFTPDGKALLAVSSGGRVASFDVATGRQTATFDLGGTPWKWSFNPDGLALAIVFMESRGQESRGVVLWDPSTGKEIGRLPVGHSNASHVSWSADGTRLAAVTDYRIWAWDVATRKPLGPSSPGHEGYITAFAFGPDGQLYSASDDHTIRSWNPTTGKPGQELIHKAWVRDLAVSDDGSLVAGSALVNDLRIWDAKSGTERFRLLGNGEMGGKRRVRFTPDGKQLIAWGDDLFLRVWDMSTGKLRAEYRTLPEGVTEAELDDERLLALKMMGFAPVDISADGSTFAFCQHKVVQLFDVASGRERSKLEVDPNGIISLALSPDGKRMIVGGRGKPTETRLSNGMTRHSSAKQHQTALWDVAAKKVIWETTSPGSWAIQVGFSPDGKRTAETVSDEDEKTHAVRIWDTESGKELGRIELPSRAGHFAFDRTGQRLAVAYQDTTAACFDLGTALKPANDK